MTFEECKAKYPFGTTYVSYREIECEEEEFERYKKVQSDSLIPVNIYGYGTTVLLVLLNTVVGYRTIDGENFEPDICNQWNIRFSCNPELMEFMDAEELEQLDKTYLLSENINEWFEDALQRIIYIVSNDCDFPGIFIGAEAFKTIEEYENCVKNNLRDYLNSTKIDVEEVMYELLYHYPVLKPVPEIFNF